MSHYHILYVLSLSAVMDEVHLPVLIAESIIWEPLLPALDRLIAEYFAFV